MAAMGVDKYQNRLIAAVGEFRDHGGTAEQAMSLVLRVYAGEKMPMVDAEAYKRKAPAAERAKEEKAFEVMRVALFGIKLSDGRDVAVVRAHELPGMARDGNLARELMKELPVLTDENRFAEIGSLITKEKAQAAKRRAELQK
jgi:hypothetical protein